jgi:hypothetical protein
LIVVSVSQLANSQQMFGDFMSLSDEVHIVFASRTLSDTNKILKSYSNAIISQFCRDKFGEIEKHISIPLRCAIIVETLCLNRFSNAFC